MKYVWNLDAELPDILYAVCVCVCRFVWIVQRKSEQKFHMNTCPAFGGSRDQGNVQARRFVRTRPVRLRWGPLTRIRSAAALRKCGGALSGAEHVMRRIRSNGTSSSLIHSRLLPTSVDNAQHSLSDTLSTFASSTLCGAKWVDTMTRGVVGGRGGVVVRLLSPHTPHGFSHVGIEPDDAPGPDVYKECELNLTERSSLLLAKPNKLNDSRLVAIKDRIRFLFPCESAIGAESSRACLMNSDPIAKCKVKLAANPNDPCKEQHELHLRRYNANKNAKNAPIKHCKGENTEVLGLKNVMSRKPAGGLAAAATYNGFYFLPFVYYNKKYIDTYLHQHVPKADRVRRNASKGKDVIILLRFSEADVVDWYEEVFQASKESVEEGTVRGSDEVYNVDDE
ncbi:hypothetical protein PR048_033256 [Dryococelus australis]|uniref:Uncharacterized protein n=1 Tax=Dryococelus australis TaxID=614101 RepID=A0ABQ9FZS4_9NEOP|nr:hypothetical protein PR048_033256 [Dryococelus australis]